MRHRRIAMRHGPTRRTTRLGPGGRAGLVLVTLILLACTIGPVFTTDPAQQDLLSILLPPSPSHLLGTDALGRDILARLLHGGARSLGVALLCVAVAASLGCALGLVAAYTGGLTGAAIMRLADLMLACPGILLALLLSGLMGGGMIPMLVGIKLTLWPQFARMARAVAAGVLDEPHVEAARLAGFPATVILRRHVLPPVLAQITTLATLGLGAAVMSIAALGFLGLGLQPPTPEWGAMINEILPYASEAPVQLAAPCVAIFLAVLGCTLAGEALAREAARTVSPP